MKGIEHVSKELDGLRFRVSRLIELDRLSSGEGRRLLKKLMDCRDLALKLDREKEGELVEPEGEKEGELVEVGGRS